ncbi:unnamed protein product [Lampetra planeri]
MAPAPGAGTSGLGWDNGATALAHQTFMVSSWAKWHAAGIGQQLELVTLGSYRSAAKQCPMGNVKWETHGGGGGGGGGRGG